MDMLGKGKDYISKHKIDKDKKEWRKYTCGYCGYSFDQAVRKIQMSESKRSRVSSQVRCPNCRNFLRTWDDGVTL